MKTKIKRIVADMTEIHNAMFPNAVSKLIFLIVYANSCVYYISYALYLMRNLGWL